MSRGENSCSRDLSPLNTCWVPHMACEKRVHVHSSSTVTEAELVMSLLRHGGIGTELHGESGARLGVSGYEVWVDARNEERARELLRELEEGSDETVVACPRCSESTPSHFERCWKCGATIPLE